MRVRGPRAPRVVPYLWVPAFFIVVGLAADLLQLVGAAFAYVVAILLCLIPRSPVLPLVVAAIATPAAASGYVLSHALGVRPIYVVAVRVAMLWITAFLVSRELRQATHRERTHGELRDARRLAAEKQSALDLALQAGRAGTFDWDISNDVNLWSDQLLDLYGIARDDFGERRADWGATLHPDDRERAMGALEHSLTSGRFEVEFRILRRDNGELRWMHGAGQVFFDAGRPVRMVGINVDITEQKRTEAALATRTEELRQTFDGTPTGLARCSRELRYLSANAAYARIVGIPLDAIAGSSIEQVLGPAGLEAMRAHIDTVLAGEPVEYETSVASRSSGSTLLLQNALTPWRDPGGTVSGWIASVTDVTARRQAEEKLKAANRQKDEFLAMMAHELRNPLAPIRNVAELLTRRLGSLPDTQPLLAILNRQSDQLARLVDDLLDVSRISQGRINLRMQRIDIAAVLDQAVETIRPLVAEKAHRLTIHKPLAPVYVSGDPSRLVQSLGNVLHNAAKYTDAGGDIDVDIQESDGMLCICVRDSGTGITPELLPNVFDLFVQSPQTLDRSEGGLGIGLTVVKQLVQMHGGTVLAESEGQGRGSTFTIRLPSVPAPDAAIGSQARVAAAPRRILVVDDNRDAADSLAIILRLDGHEVSTAYSGRTALELAQQMAPEVVLLDIGLPGMDGYEVAQQLRAHRDTAGLRVIALTGYGQSEDRARALAAGFSGYLTKPVDHEVLQQMLAAEQAARPVNPRSGAQTAVPRSI